MSACIAKISGHLCLKILAHEKVLQILPIAFSQVKIGNTYENLLNEISQIICFFVLSKRNYEKSI